ncbi:peroxisomal sarcosine oxidase [Polypterus senegalus]|nr:peroxisomal sarcosine oxidase [Polypterus senegalus]
MGSQNFDHIVIGAGIQGSFTAYHLAKNKQKTLLLEQFILPHSRGSSHGQSRIIREAYHEDYYTCMIPECYRLWAEVEAEASINIFRKTGLLVIGAEEDRDFQGIRRVLQQENLTREQFAKRFSSVQLPAGKSVVVDENAGVLFADRGLKSVQALFQRFGGVIHDGERVMEIIPGSTITLTTSNGKYQARSVVITAGPWAQSLLTSIGIELPLQTLRINVCYWKEKIPGTYGIQKNFPCFIDLRALGSQDDVYGLPSNEYPGLMKICLHSGTPSQPDERDKNPSDEDIKMVSDFVSKYFPGLVPVPAVMEHCMYTVTPDKDFILDHHPSHSNIVIGAGFSGHGFKFAPVIGKILSELSLGSQPSYDISSFKISRF